MLGAVLGLFSLERVQRPLGAPAVLASPMIFQGSGARGVSRRKKKCVSCHENGITHPQPDKRGARKWPRNPAPTLAQPHHRSAAICSNRTREGPVAPARSRGVRVRTPRMFRSGGRKDQRVELSIPLPALFGKITTAATLAERITSGSNTSNTRERRRNQAPRAQRPERTNTPVRVVHACFALLSSSLSVRCLGSSRSLALPTPVVRGLCVVIKFVFFLQQHRQHQPVDGHSRQAGSWSSLGAHTRGSCLCWGIGQPRPFPSLDTVRWRWMLFGC